MENKIDMKWGSPAFLNEYWIDNPVTTDFYIKDLNYQIGTNRLIKNKILKLHQKTKNANIEDKFIVVGCGATQILRGLIKILGGPVYAEPPHFSRFPIFTKSFGYSWDSVINNIVIKTIPNNPDNKIKNIPTNKTTVYDLCYNWPQYTEPQCYNEDIMVFSLAKATGHASSRIGWCILKDKILATNLENFIELDTAGVSVDSQNLLASIVDHQMKIDKTVWDYGKLELNKRWSKLKEIDLPFKLINDSGMFIWAKGTCPNFIEGLSGENFGVDGSYFRLNLGCEKEKFYEFIKRLREKN